MAKSPVATLATLAWSATPRRGPLGRAGLTACIADLYHFAAIRCLDKSAGAGQPAVTNWPKWRWRSWRRLANCPVAGGQVGEAGRVRRPDGPPSGSLSD